MSFYSKSFAKIYGRLRMCEQGESVVVQTNDTYVVWCFRKGHIDEGKPNAEIVNAIFKLAKEKNIRLFVNYTGRTMNLDFDVREYIFRQKDYVGELSNPTIVNIESHFEYRR